VTGNSSTAGTGRVLERRRAVALARHYREFERLSIRQIADRLGRSPATIKAYFYARSEVTKRRSGLATEGLLAPVGSGGVGATSKPRRRAARSHRRKSFERGSERARRIIEGYVAQQRRIYDRNLRESEIAMAKVQMSSRRSFV